MPSKPNYNHQRLERERAKKAAKEAKMQERKDAAAARKAAEAGGIAPDEPAADESKE